MRDLDKRDMQNSGQAKHPVIHDKGKKSIVLDYVDISADDDLSLSSSPNLSLAKSNKDRSRQRHSHCPAFSISISDMFLRVTG